MLKHFIGDVLGIPQDQIRTVRLKNTFLWKRYKREKMGILDVLVDLNDDTKIDIELQIKVYAHWDRRLLFYLAKLFTEDLQSGQDYGAIRKCVGISILNFNLSDREEYHSTYYLMDEKGNKLSDALEVHILELKKTLKGQSDIDNWIRFFNVETEEDINMIKTKNPGILEAIGMLRHMSLRGRLRAEYEEYVKYIRDVRMWKNQMQIDAMVEGRQRGLAEGRQQGLAEGKEQGLAEGKEQGLVEGKQQGLAEGKQQGLAESILELLEMHNAVPKDLRERILLEQDEKKLRQWLKAAAVSESIDDFQDRIKER